MPKRTQAAAAVIQKYGDDEKPQALDAAKRLETLVAWLATLPLTILLAASLYYLLDAPSF